jgi:hypothetical protein
MSCTWNTTAQGSELHLDVPRLVWTQEPVLLLKVFTLQGLAALAAPGLPGQMEPLLLLNACVRRGLSCAWTYLHYSVACANLVVSRLHKSVLLLNVSTVNNRGI